MFGPSKLENLKNESFCLSLIIIIYLTIGLLNTYDKYFLRPEKSKFSFFALRTLQFWDMALVFHYNLRKCGLDIFPVLKSKQIKYKKTKIAHYFVILAKIKFVYTF